LFQRLLARPRLVGKVALVLGQKALLGQRKVQVQHHQIGQGGQTRQDLGRLAIVVRTLERAAAIALLAHPAGHGPIAAGDGVELGQLAMAHLHGLVAIVDHQQAGHG
jgi:hypothetical protein